MNGIGLSQHIGLSLYQERTAARRRYLSEALKAFKIFECNLGRLYNCNVLRLKECNRLGEEKEVGIWQTHFFLHSNSFQDIKGVIFNDRPGIELAELSRVQAGKIYLVTKGDNRIIVDTSNGDRHTVDREIVFASAE